MSTEAAVRSALHKHIAASAHERIQKVIDEFWVPLTHERVDVAVIGSVMQAFEIKTAHDTLKRLPRQVEAYSRIFDQCTAVVAERHAERALTKVPRWWGVLVIRGGETPTFARIQKPDRNPSVDPTTLVRLLWRDEVHSALVELGSKPLPVTSRVVMWEELLRIANMDALGDIVQKAITTRRPAAARFPSRRFRSTLISTIGP